MFNTEVKEMWIRSLVALLAICSLGNAQSTPQARMVALNVSKFNYANLDSNGNLMITSGASATPVPVAEYAAPVAMSAFNSITGKFEFLHVDNSGNLMITCNNCGSGSGVPNINGITGAVTITGAGVTTNVGASTINIASGGSGSFNTSTVIITATQLAAMTAKDVNSIQVVPAQGVNNIIVPVVVTIAYLPGDTPFTGAGSFAVFPQGFPNQLVSANGFLSVGDLGLTFTDPNAIIISGLSTTVFTSVGQDNLPLMFGCWQPSGSGTGAPAVGGNGSLKITTQYLVTALN